MSGRSSGTFTKVRSHGRFAVELPCRVEGESLPAGAHYLRARLRDISLVGAYVDSSEVPAFGTEVSLVVQLPTATDELVLRGVVRWAKLGGFGVQFDGLRAYETHALTRFIRELIVREREAPRDSSGAGDPSAASPERVPA
jgi:hypothetical protein